MAEQTEKLSHARIKLIDSGLILIISIDKIVEFEKNPPAHEKDFDKKKIYTATLTSDDFDDVEFTQDEDNKTYAVQIASITSSIEEMAKWIGKRGNFPPLDFSVINEYKNNKVCNKKLNEENYDTEEILSSDVISKRNKDNAKLAAVVEKKTQNKIFNKKMEQFMKKDNLILTDLFTTAKETDTNLINNVKEKTVFEKIDDELVDELSLWNENVRDDFITSEVNESSNNVIEKEKENHLNRDKIKYDNTCIKCNGYIDQIMTLKKNYTDLELKFTTMENNYQKVQQEIITLSNINKKLKEKQQSSYELTKPGTSSSNNATESNTCELGDPEMTTSTPLSDDTSSGYYSIISRNCKKRLFYAKKTTDEEHLEKKMKTIENFTDVPKAKDFKKEIVKTLKNGEKEKMISLGNNILIRKDEWNTALAMSTASRFTKEILRALYSKKELSQRSVTGDPNCKTPKGTTSRKQFTPIKHLAIRRSLSYYLIKRKRLEKSSKEFQKLLDSQNAYLTQEVNTVIQNLKKNQETDQKSTRSTAHRSPLSTISRTNDDGTDSDKCSDISLN